jgi:regulator of G-protein signaling
MQDNEHGVPVRSQKIFLTSIPAAFMGYDLIEWLMDRLSIEDSCKRETSERFIVIEGMTLYSNVNFSFLVEAVHLANLLCQFGYYFPVNELKNLFVKDDSSLYRFQTPYYWPSQHHTPDNIEYAIYLAKRSQRNKQKHGLEDYEMEAYNNLKKILTSKWEFVSMQSDEQVRKV